VFAPPNVRRLARELGVDITTIPGSGPSGRVSESDVRAAAEADEQDEPADEAVEAESESEDGGKQLKSAVRRVGEDESDESDEDDSQLKSAVRRVGGDESDDADAETASGDQTEDPAVKSAVRKVGADDGTESTRDQTLATPATRKVARELGVDIDSVPTDDTRDGEAYVTEEAVRSYAERRHAALADSPAEGRRHRTRPPPPRA